MLSSGQLKRVFRVFVNCAAMVEKRKRKPLVLSSTKALVDSLLNSHRTAEDGDGINEIDPGPSARSLQFTAGILRVSDDSSVNAVDCSVLVGLSTDALKELSITSGSLVLINNVSRNGQAVVLDPPNPDDSSQEHGSAISVAPKTMLIFPSYVYPHTESGSVDHQVAYVSPILAFNLSLHQSCLKSIVQQGREKLSSLFEVKANDDINEKNNEPGSVRIGLESWAKMPKYALHSRASFVKIPECGNRERLKTRSSESLIDLALNDYFSVDRFLTRGDLFTVCINWNCKSELCIRCNQKMPNCGENNILQAIKSYCNDKPAPCTTSCSCGQL